MAVVGGLDGQSALDGECSWMVQGKPRKGVNMTTVAKDRQSTGELRPLLSVKEVAEILGIHVRTVWRLAAMAEMGEGSFPRPVRIARKTIRWQRAALETYLNTLAAEAGR